MISKKLQWDYNYALGDYEEALEEARKKKKSKTYAAPAISFCYLLIYD